MEHNLDKLKERLLPLYVNLRKDCNADENLCPFLMQWGDKFPIRENDGIIFYGRATNGWSHGTWDDDIFFSNDDNSNERGWNRDGLRTNGPLLKTVITQIDPNFGI